MSRIALFLALAVSVLAEGNPWAKVQELKSGSELRIYKKGASQPVLATFDEANDERMVIVVKNKQMAVAKEDIDQVDARPVVKKTPRKLTFDQSTKTKDPEFTPHPNPGIPAPETSSSSSVALGGTSKPDFETVYRRAAAETKK
jgi:hypothetical protein